MSEFKTIAVTDDISNTRSHSIIEALLSLNNDEKNKYNLKIRALTFDTNKIEAQKLRDRGVEVIQADPLNKSSLIEAFRDCWGVFGCSSSFSSHNLLKDEIQQNINIIDAAIECNVSRFVYGSTAVLRLKTKDEIEQYLINKKDKFEHGIFIIRPVWFMENFNKLISIQNGCFSLPIPENRKIQWVSFHDIAMITAQAFFHKNKIDSLNIASDELTPNEIAEILTKISKQPVCYHQATFYNHLLSKFKKDQSLLIFDNIKTDFEANIKQCYEWYPDLQTFEQFAKQHFTNKDFGCYNGKKLITNISLIGLIGCTVSMATWALYNYSK